MRDYKARGIVLHSIKYGESSLILYLLTDLLGRQTYMIHGVRSSKGKGNKAAIFQPMFVIDFIGLTSPKMEMHRMKEVENALPLHSIPFDVRKSTISLFMAEIIYRLVKEVEPNSPLFIFIYNSIEALDKLENGVSNFHLWFLVHLSYHLGFYPGNEYRDGEWFDIKRGKFVSLQPYHKTHFSQDNSQILSTLMDFKISQLDQLNLSRNQRSSFLHSIIDYFGYHLDTISQVQSLKILQQIFI